LSNATRVAFVTYRGLPELNDDDRRAATALADLGSAPMPSAGTTSVSIGPRTGRWFSSLYLAHHTPSARAFALAIQRIA
jgi:hypothetical protein